MRTDRQYRRALAAAGHEPDDDDNRTALNVRICTKSHQGWRELAGRYGVTVGGMIDHFGHLFAVHAEAPAELVAAAFPELQQAIEDARRLDADRRRRA